MHDANFWNEKYIATDTGWDIGYISSPLKAYFDQIENKSVKILIPGAGNAYEAEYLYQQGFDNVYVLDIASEALKGFTSRVPSFPKSRLILDDFFLISEQFDLIIEQTFFCALPKELRPKYVHKMSELLSDQGKLVGLLFQVPLYEDHPPYGGSEEEYRSLFGQYFEIEIMETAHNSIKPRQGSELFIKLIKKSS